MALINKILNIVDLFPSINVNADKLQKVFFNLSITVDARKYVSFCLFFSLIGILALFFKIYIALIMLFLSLFFYFLPFIEIETVKKEIEAEIPIFLRQVGSLIRMGVPFKTALSFSLRDGTLSYYFKPTLKEINQGVAVQKALYDFSLRLGTETTKRAIAQMIYTYEHGGGEELKRLGDEILNLQRHRLKEYSAKSSMFALFFVVFSVVAPMLYLISILLASSFGNQQDPLSLILVIDVIVPAIGFIIVITSIAFFPFVTFSKKEISAITLIPALIIAFMFFLDLSNEIKFGFIALIAVFAVFYFLKDYKEKKEIEDIENKLGDALLMASALPKGAHIKDFFFSMCKNMTGKLKTEFCIAYKQLLHLVSVDKVIQDLKKRINSQIFARTMDIIDYSFKSGKNITERLAELAEDILTFSELKREQISLIAMQKYSIIIGSLLVPFILSSAFSIISGLSVIDSNILSILRFSVVPAYIIMMSSISSIFISSIEGNKTSELLYFCFFAITEMFIYFNTHIEI